MQNLIDDDLEESESDESDSDSNDDDDESNEKSSKRYFNNNKGLIVCFNHTLLGFIYLRQSVQLA